MSLKTRLFRGIQTSTPYGGSCAWKSPSFSPGVIPSDPQNPMTMKQLRIAEMIQRGDLKVEPPTTSDYSDVALMRLLRAGETVAVVDGTWNGSSKAIGEMSPTELEAAWMNSEKAMQQGRFGVRLVAALS